MKEFILLRHAQSMHNARKTDDLNSCLTSEGLNQAEALAKHLSQNYDLDKFEKRVSPYLRCIQTASHISPVNFKIDLGVMEVASLYPKNGVVTLLKYNEMEITNNAQYDYSVFNESYVVEHKYEPVEDFYARMKNYIESFDDGSYLIVSHGGVVSTLANLITDKPHGRWGECHNASISHFVDGEEICYSKVIY